MAVKRAQSEPSPSTASLSQDEIRSVLTQLSEAVLHLHTHEIAHCDICLENVMMDG